MSIRNLSVFFDLNGKGPIWDDSFISENRSVGRLEIPLYFSLYCNVQYCRVSLTDLINGTGGKLTTTTTHSRTGIISRTVFSIKFKMAFYYTRLSMSHKSNLVFSNEVTALAT